MIHLHSLFRKNNYFFFLFFNLFIPSIFAQIPVGTWRTHPAYLSARFLTLSNEQVFCATTNGFFALNKSDFSFQNFSATDGFYGQGISQIAYEKSLNALVITYQDGTIELLKERNITEINTIAQANITQNKNTRNITFSNQNAYLALPFGVVVLDLRTEEIRETYQNLGENGESLSIWQVAFAKDSIFAATNKGIIKAPIASNLKDFNNWIISKTTQGLPEDTSIAIVNLNDEMYTAFPSEGVFKYDFQNTNWQSLPNSKFDEMQSLSVLNNQIALCSGNQVFLWDSQGNQQTISDALIQSPQTIRQEDNSTLFIADKNNGLLIFSENRWQSFTPNSPAQPEVWKVYEYNEKITAVSGGYQSLTIPLERDFGIYIFEDNLWSNQNPNIEDITATVFNPSENKLYFSSMKNGIFSRNINEENWTQVSSAPITTQANSNLAISALTVDKDGNLWATNPNFQGGNVILKKDKSDNWTSFSAFNTLSQSPVEILVDRLNNYAWIRIEPEIGGGIWVLDAENNRSKYLNEAFANGALPNSQVLSFAQDKESRMWVGTAAGVAVFTNPARVFSNDFTASTPIYEGRPLLRAERVQTIAIDGGNQKWIGTNNGAWLFDSEGNVLLEYFNTENSPLPSNDVRSIAINPTTGEVFFATTAGIVSYRAKATEATSVYSEVNVFPNPVTPEFQGFVAISGLVENAQVKITDISGKLIFQTQAQGGTATWNLQGYNGRRVNTGVYLVFSANADGSESLVSKIAIVE